MHPPPAQVRAILELHLNRPARPGQPPLQRPIASIKVIKSYQTVTMQHRARERPRRRPSGKTPTGFVRASFSSPRAHRGRRMDPEQVMSAPPPTPVIPTNRPPTNPQTEYNGSIACMADFRLLAVSPEEPMRQCRRFDARLGPSVRDRVYVPSTEELPLPRNICGTRC